MAYLLIEDDAASDALDSFNKKMKAITGFTVDSFKNDSKTRSNSDDYMISLINGEYRLTAYADARQWHLSTVKDYDK